MLVKATREGLIGARTATGYVIDGIVPFVALPSVRALGRFVRISHPLTGYNTFAIVLDVGPWNTHDDSYVFQGARPQAESGIDHRGRVTNKAGIDLSEPVWTMLGMLDNDQVDWVFLT